MKKNIILIILFLFTMYCYSQQVVTLNEIKIAGIHYMSAQNPVRAVYSISEIDTISYISKDSGPAIYEVLFYDGNSVLLSGSKACIPVVGYNISGKNESVVLSDDIPPGLQAMLNNLVTEIDACLLNDTITLYHLSTWNEILSPNYLQSRNRATQIGPLTTSKWGQSRSNDGLKHAYNYYVTETSNNCGSEEYCPAGCVAVAMAQVLYYWKHPMNKGLLTHYNWCNMSDFLHSYNNNYETQRNAIARLIQDCGETANMNYCIANQCASFAWPLEDLSHLFAGVYNLSNEIDHKWRMWNKGEWVDLLKEDINNGWPVLYSSLANVIDGHCFICDGYDSDDNFCFNWGWRGAYNGQWFTLKNLTPSNDNYKNFQNAMFHIRPDNSYIDQCEASVNLANIYYQYQVTGYNDFWNLVPDNGKILQSCDASLLDAWRTIPAGETSQYTAFESVILKSGFTAESGCNFKANIKDCPNCENYKSKSQLLINSSEIEGIIEYSEKTIELELKTENYGGNNDFKLYPNPANSEFFIVYILNYDMTVRFELYDSIGNKVKTLLNIDKQLKGSYKYSFSTIDLSNGIYIYVFRTANKSISGKIIINK